MKKNIYVIPVLINANVLRTQMFTPGLLRDSFLKRDEVLREIGRLNGSTVSILSVKDAEIPVNHDENFADMSDVSLSHLLTFGDADASRLSDRDCSVPVTLHGTLYARGADPEAAIMTAEKWINDSLDVVLGSDLPTSVLKLEDFISIGDLDLDGDPEMVWEAVLLNGDPKMVWEAALDDLAADGQAVDASVDQDDRHDSPEP